MVRFKIYQHGGTSEAPSSPGKSSPPRPNATFINLTHPAQRKDARARKKVAQYIGVNFCNRSRPVARKEATWSSSTYPNILSSSASQKQLRAREFS